MRLLPRTTAAALVVLVLPLDAAAGKKGHTVRSLAGGTGLLSQLWSSPDTRLRLLQFEDKEKITLWYNKVGPYNNPQETYQYFDLPFCRPEGAAALACCALR
jgi:hypothetical protein